MVFLHCFVVSTPCISDYPSTSIAQEKQATQVRLPSIPPHSEALRASDRPSRGCPVGPVGAVGVRLQLPPRPLKQLIRKVIRLDIAFNRRHRKSFSGPRKGRPWLNHYKSSRYPVRTLWSIVWSGSGVSCDSGVPRDLVTSGKSGDKVAALQRKKGTAVGTETAWSGTHEKGSASARAARKRGDSLRACRR